ncbi:glycosyltransferase [Spongiibacter marinus]|uniref:glycosyltransferase n=1 Tax=Spongiibacter marinus TaxID=354246 RepID=UPI00195F7149|nr:hypothetical protein [Spongiibacter marinus]
MEHLADQLTLVTVGYNSAEVLGPHIESLRQSAQSPLPRWLVVDNASSDGTVELLENYKGVIELLQSPQNVGFGAACNLGIAQATTRYVAVLNPDTKLSEMALQELLFELKARKAAIAGPSLTAATEDSVEKVDWLVGAVLLIDCQLMREVGFFDEQFFLYEEDVDLCKRANDTGLDVILCKRISIPHVGGGSTERSKKINRIVHFHKGRSYALYVRKHGLRKSLIDNYVAKNHRRCLIALFTFGFRRYTRAKAKLDGVKSVFAEGI